MKKYTIRHGSIAWYCRKYFKPVSLLVCIGGIMMIMQGATFAFAEPENPAPIMRTLEQHKTYTVNGYYEGDNVFITEDGEAWWYSGFEQKCEFEPVNITFDCNGTTDNIYDDFIVEVESKLISLGKYTISHYCRENYPHICNNGDATYTATMTVPTPGRTIAVDPSVIPYGTEVIINGNTYIAEDCGGAIKGNRIDVLCDTHEEALQKGMQTAEVFIIEQNL